jgi:hypothetical protein
VLTLQGRDDDFFEAIIDAKERGRKNGSNIKVDGRDGL